MRNSLTSKERRGLAAVVAAALLCISSGFIFRNCSSYSGGRGGSVPPSYESPVQPDAACGDTVVTDSRSRRHNKQDNKNKQNKSKRDRNKSDGQKKKTLKAFPTRDPLSEPCD